MFLSNNNKFLLLGFFAGVTSAFLGVGGGVVIVPALVLILDHDIKKALGTSLAAVTFAALAGGLVHYALNSSSVRFDIAGVIFLGALAGSRAGAAIAKRVRGRLLEYMFAILLLIVGLRQSGIVTFGGGDGDVLLSYPALIALGCVAGVCSALFGIGGGVLVVPVLNIFGGIPMHEAVATSLAVIVPTAAVGTVFHARYGHIIFPAIRFLVPAAIAGAVLGAVLSNVAEPGLLKTVFSIYVLFCAVKLFLRKEEGGNMKKTGIMLVLSLLALSFSAYAHPPAEIELDYNPVTEVLTATIDHPVLEMDKHYVAQVDVAVNGKKVIQHNITIQDNTDSQTLSYTLPGVKRGDRIEVEASCSIAGTKTELLEVE